jgi:hypothetical protein
MEPDLLISKRRLIHGGETIIKAVAYGESTSLGIKSRPEEDSAIITRQITNVFG